VTEIVCEVHVYQNGAENRMAKLKVAEIMEKVNRCQQYRSVKLYMTTLSWAQINLEPWIDVISQIN